MAVRGVGGASSCGLWCSSSSACRDPPPRLKDPSARGLPGPPGRRCGRRPSPGGALGQPVQSKQSSSAERGAGGRAAARPAPRPLPRASPRSVSRSLARRLHPVPRSSFLGRLWLRTFPASFCQVSATSGCLPPLRASFLEALLSALVRLTRSASPKDGATMYPQLSAGHLPPGENWGHTQTHTQTHTHALG